MRDIPGRLLRKALFVACFSLAACGGGSGSSGALPCLTAANAAQRAPMDLRTELSAGYVEPLCATTSAGTPRCLGYRLSPTGMSALGYARAWASFNSSANASCPQGSGGGAVGGTTTNGGTMPSGYGPSDLQNAYGLTAASASGGNGRIVAVIELGDAPHLESDLGVYRSTFGLSACTTANRCLRKVDQDGDPLVPPVDIDWAAETTADTEMISAICPNCGILVIELSEPSDDFAVGIATAARLGATAVSNSWGMNENLADAAIFSLPGVTLVAASGDNGYGTPLSPADYGTVIAVGGTSLTRASNARGWNESAWSGSGSGCSQTIAKPVWQHDTGCGMRTVSDVSFDADPATGVAFYDTTPGGADNGWGVVGGTSIGSPAIASIYALAGTSANDASALYANASALRDITNGPAPEIACAHLYLCDAQAGYDAPTGNGTPEGLGAF